MEKKTIIVVILVILVIFLIIMNIFDFSIVSTSALENVTINVEVLR